MPTFGQLAIWSVIVISMAGMIVWSGCRPGPHGGRMTRWRTFSVSSLLWLTALIATAFGAWGFGTEHAYKQLVEDVCQRGYFWYPPETANIPAIDEDGKVLLIRIYRKGDPSLDQHFAGIDEDGEYLWTESKQGIHWCFDFGNGGFHGHFGATEDWRLRAETEADRKRINAARQTGWW